MVLLSPVPLPHLNDPLYPLSWEGNCLRTPRESLGNWTRVEPGACLTPQLQDQLLDEDTWRRQTKGSVQQKPILEPAPHCHCSSVPVLFTLHSITQHWVSSPIQDFFKAWEPCEQHRDIPLELPTSHLNTWHLNKNQIQIYFHFLIENPLKLPSWTTLSKSEGVH